MTVRRVPVVRSVRRRDVEAELWCPTVGPYRFEVTVLVDVQGNHVPRLDPWPDISDTGDICQEVENLFGEGETVDPFGPFVDRRSYYEVNLPTDVGSELIKAVAEPVRQEERRRQKCDAQHNCQGREGKPQLAARDVPEGESEHPVSRRWP